jgi:hypothetical protein
MMMAMAFVVVAMVPMMMSRPGISGAGDGRYPLDGGQLGCSDRCDLLLRARAEGVFRARIGQRERGLAVLVRRRERPDVQPFIVGKAFGGCGWWVFDCR